MENPPYLYQGNYPSWGKVAKLLRVFELELVKRKMGRSEVDGLPLVYLEERMELLSKNENWDAFIDVLGLAVYGIAIFSHLNDYVDLATIDVFLACQERGKNPIVAVLANTYYTIHSCHDKKRGRLVCCLHALYLWLIAYTFTSKCTTTCHVEDFKCCCVKKRMGGEWAHFFRNTMDKSTCWYPKWNKREEVVYQCGNFPNVPLIGTQGCINYNLSIALKQSGYAILHLLDEESITPLIIHGLESPNVRMLRKIRLAWERVDRRGRDLGPRSHGASTNYKNWLRTRVSLIKLPFSGPLLTTNNSLILETSKNRG
ncbi:hypothetical protein CR513_49508, partial [Mucuna pruriens]